MIPIVVLLFDGATLALLLLVPLAAPLGLADVDMPASAVAGWAMVVAPLLLSVAVLLGSAGGIGLLGRPSVVATAFVACAVALVLFVVLTIEAGRPAGIARMGEGADPARMRGFALTGAALFAMNLLALWRPFARVVDEELQGGGRAR